MPPAQLSRAEQETETAAEAVQKAMAFWGYPTMSRDSQDRIAQFAARKRKYLTMMLLRLPCLVLDGIIHEYTQVA